jgi:hypothetical protein
LASKKAGRFPGDKVNFQTGGAQRYSAMASGHIVRELTGFIDRLKTNNYFFAKYL